MKYPGTIVTGAVITGISLALLLFASVPGLAADLELVCPCSVASISQSSLVVTGQVVNRDPTATSGALRLRAIAHPDPSPGLFFVLGDHPFIQVLSPGSGFASTPLKLGYIAAPAGDYFLSLVLQEMRFGIWVTVDTALMADKVFLDQNGGGSWDSSVFFDGDPVASFTDSQVSILLPAIINQSQTVATGNLSLVLRQADSANIFDNFIALDSADLGGALGVNSRTTEQTVVLNFDPVADPGFDYFFVAIFDASVGHGVAWHLIRSNVLPIPERTFDTSSVDVLLDSDADGVSDFNETFVGSDPNSDLVTPGASVISVAVFYSQGVAAVVTDPVTRIQHMIEAANQMYQDSGVAVELQLTTIVQRNMDESISNTSLLSNFMDRGTGPFSDITEFRRNNGVDVVVAIRPIVNDDTCGVANLLGDLQDGIVTEAELANSALFINCRDRTLIHEIGHIMGLDHSRPQVLSEGIGGGTFRWSVGHGVQNQFATIMADDFGFAQDINVFSSPLLTCRRVPCGVDRSDPLNGADAVQSLNTVRFQVAAFTPTGSPPVIQLNDSSNITVAVGAIFNDPGALATDAEDGDLTGSLTAVNNVQIDSLGSYVVNYSVTDNDGNFVTLSRTVVVAADRDSDGVADISDTFPDDPLESVDTDNDDVGNNADSDDDGDGIPDLVEISVGLDPLDPNDVTGSPREIFWRHAINGQNVIWSMESQHRVERNSMVTVVDPHWKVEGMADFTGDGTDEVFFRHQTRGENRLWKIENGARQSSDAIRTAHPDWFVVAMGDFDADGDADLMWRNRVNGANRYWEMEGLFRMSSLEVRTVVLSWHVAGSGDFDGDGRHDLLWRNSNGANVVWLMQSESRSSRGSLPTVAGDWEVVGIGDFDADGMDDILWHNPETGANTIWLLSGVSRKSRRSIPSTPAGWRPFAVLDMNGDGLADILWRNSISGANRVWLMNGTTRTSSLAVNPVSEQNWVPVAVGNVNN